MQSNKQGVKASPGCIAISARADEMSDLSDLYESKVYPNSNWNADTKFLLEQERRKLMKEMFNITLP